MRFVRSRTHSDLQRHIAMAVLVVFSTLALFGLSLSMQMGDHGMSDCAFMSKQASVCPMTVFEHIATWQHMMIGLTVLAVVSVACVVLAVSILRELILAHRFQRRWLREQSPGIALFRLLPQLFAQGVLHRRVYA